MDDKRISNLNSSEKLSGGEIIPITQYSDKTGGLHTVQSTVSGLKEYIMQEIKDAFCPVGTITAYAGALSGVATPMGWLMCDGREVMQTDYPALYDSIKATYGAAAAGKFKLPSMRGRAVAGYCSTAVALEYNMIAGGGWPSNAKVALGSTDGEYYHKLLMQEVPLDNNQLNIPAAKDYAVLGVNALTYSNANTPIFITQPFIVMNYIIKY
jgi:microcystin-dependent protein